MINKVADIKIIDYDYLKMASMEAWSWEFVRRNSDYILAWEKHLILDVLDYAFNQNEMLKASRFGLLFFVDPSLRSNSIDVFWSPKTTSYVLKCSLTKHSQNSNSKNVILADVKLKMNYIETRDGYSHLLLKEKNGAIQLMFEGELDLNTYFDFDIQIPIYCDFAEQLHSAICLEQLMIRQKCNLFRFVSSEKSQKLIEILFLFDLSRLGLSHREMAINVFGEDAILGGWDGASDNIRSKTRRLISLGEKFVNAGSLTFMKPKK